MTKRSQPPVEIPLELKERRDGAAAKIRDRIQKGLELKAEEQAPQAFQRELRNLRDPQAFEGEYKKWNAYNESLLKALFTNDDPLTEYTWSVSTGLRLGGESDSARHRRHIDELTLRCNALESLVERLELIPLAASVSNAAEVSAEHSFDAAWQLIHPKVKAVAQERFDHGHYADAVFAALTALNNEVKAIVRARGAPELDGVTLMQTAFSPDNPRIVLADLSSQTGKNMQRGYMDLFAGAMSAVRNPKAHDNISIPPERALHLLFLGSMLWTTLDDRV